MTTTDHPALDLLDRHKPEPDDDRYWITARGAVRLGRRLDPGAGSGALVCWSDELERWVRMR